MCTLEPCSHHGRTPPCVDGDRRGRASPASSSASRTPTRSSAGRGIAALRAAGIDVTVGVEAAAVAEQLAPYLVHRRTGRPYVVLKLAATVDGGTAAPDGTSQWITGPEARADAHRLRAESQAVLVGAGTVRADDPALTVRHVAGPDPLRVVLGRAPAGAKVHPCLELSGDLGAVLDELGGRGVLQLLVEGGATVAHAFHAAGLVDRYVVYLAPAVFGGDDALGLFRGPGAPTIDAPAARALRLRVGARRRRALGSGDERSDGDRGAWPWLTTSSSTASPTPGCRPSSARSAASRSRPRATT